MALRPLLRLLTAFWVAAACVLAAHALTPKAEAQSGGGSDGDARALFAEARVAYAAQRFEDAARAFRRAYLLSPRYPLLYNIGQSELRAGHDALALEAFEAFLRQAPGDNPNRSEVEERAQILRSMGVTAAAASTTTRITTAPEPMTITPAPVVTTTAITPPPIEPTGAVVTPSVIPETREVTPPVEPPTLENLPPVATEGPPAIDASPPRSDDGPGAAPWIVFGGGGAALVTGAVLMGVGASSAADVTGAPDGSRWSELEGVASSASTTWGVGMVLAGVGLAAASVGLVWALSGSSSGASDEATARLRVGPTSVAFEGEF